MLTTKQILTRIKSNIDHPATVRELMERLTVPREQRVTFCRRLTNLVAKGELIKIRGNRYGLPSRMHLVTGEVHVNPRGFGFVTPEESTTGLDGDLYVAGGNLNQAMKAANASMLETGDKQIEPELQRIADMRMEISEQVTAVGDAMRGDASYWTVVD